MKYDWSPLTGTLDLLGECPTWEGETGTLYWTDIPGKALKSYVPRTGTHAVWPMPEEVGSFALRAQGGLVVALRSGFALFDLQTRALQPLPSPDYDRSVMRFNDGRAGPDGRFYAGTMYEPRGRADGRLFRLDTDLTWSELPDTAAVISNGLAFTRDAKTMYHADSPDGIIDTRSFDAATGAIGPRRAFARIPAPREAGGVKLGHPDGAAMDEHDFYWIAMYDGQRLVRYAPDGTIDREIAFPVRCPTMVCFGDDNLDHLYVTTSRNGRPAAELAAQPDAGRVFVAKVDVRGVPEPRFRG